MTRKDLSMWVVNEDTGCGIIKRGKQELFPKQPINFKTLSKHRKAALNLISADEFVKLEL